MKPLGIIVARGGSKRIPRKNVAEFLGRPLLSWTIDVAKKSEVFDRLILLTDDEEIAGIGRSLGIDVPFMEPSELASDTAHVSDALKWAITELKQREGYNPSWFILLEPSSPGRQPFHIREIAHIIHQEPNLDSVVGISETPPHFSPFKALDMTAEARLVRYDDGEQIRNLTHQNQKIQKTYFINSAVYAFRTANLFSENPSLWGDRVRGYVMDSKYALDIDIPEDWDMAEMKMQKLITEA